MDNPRNQVDKAAVKNRYFFGVDEDSKVRCGKYTLYRNKASTVADSSKYHLLLIA
jgi:hypothetical protein